MADEGEDNLAVWAGGQLLGGAVGAVGANLFTYGLSQVGLTLPGAIDLSGISRALDQIVGMLSDIRNEMADVEEQILAAIDMADFNTRSGLLTTIIDQIFTLTQRYKNYVDAIAGLNKTQEDSASILADIEQQLLDSPSLIHTIVAGDGATTPLYQTYADAIKKGHRFLTHRHSDAVQARINFYQSVQYLQQLLLVAYYNVKGTSGDVAMAIKTFQDNMLAENRFQALPIPKGVIIDTTCDLALYVGPNRLATAFQEWNRSVIPPDGGPDWNAYIDIPGLPKLREGGPPGCMWRVALICDLVGDSNAAQYQYIDPNPYYPRPPNPTGIFGGYDSQGGTVTHEQWLLNGLYQHLGDYPDGAGAGRLWAQVPPAPAICDITGTDTLNFTISSVPIPRVGDTDPGGDVAYPLLVRNRHRGAWFEIDDSLLKADGNAGYIRPVLLKATNGKYWSRISPSAGSDANLIWAVKDKPDSFCQFGLTYFANGTVTIRADNGKFLSRIALDGGANPIEATKDVADQFCEFGFTTLPNGMVALSADNGKFLGNTNRGFQGVPGPSIEAAKDATDESCQIQIIGGADTDNPWRQTSWPATDGTKYVIQVKGGMDANAGSFLGPNSAVTGVALFKNSTPLWTFQLVAAGVYRIKPATLDRYLNCHQVDGNPPQNLTTVDLWSTDDNSGRQQWTLTATGDGSFTITIEKSGALNHPGYKYLSCPPNGSEIDLWNGGAGARQHWLVSVSPAQG